MRRDDHPLLGRCRDHLRGHGYALATERTDLPGIPLFLGGSGRHRRPLEPAAIPPILECLGRNRHVATRAQALALDATVFRFGNVSRQGVAELAPLRRAAPGERVSLVLSQNEVRRLLACPRGLPRLARAVVCGADLRAGEVLRLRVQDVDFSWGERVLRQGKGGRDRRGLLPAPLVAAVRAPITRSRRRAR